jgi:hypothetical protein
VTEAAPIAPVLMAKATPAAPAMKPVRVIVRAARMPSMSTTLSWRQLREQRHFVVLAQSRLVGNGPGERKVSVQTSAISALRSFEVRLLPYILNAATTPQVDSRITAVRIYFQSVARLLNRGALHEEIFASYFDMTPTVWKSLKPITAVIRERSRQIAGVRCLPSSTTTKNCPFAIALSSDRIR